MNTPDPFEVFAEQDFPLDVESVQAPEPPAPDLHRMDPQIAQMRLPPQSIEAEQAVLGGLLLDNRAMEHINGIVYEHDFYRHDHRLIWHHINELIQLKCQVLSILNISKNCQTSKGFVFFFINMSKVFEKIF